MFRHERDGISIANPTENYLTGTLLADADGLYLVVVGATNPLLCTRYSYTSTGRNGQSLLLRSSQ
jgi:hypothetical protein